MRQDLSRNWEILQDVHDTSGRDTVGDIGSLSAGVYWADTEHYAGKHAGLL